MHYAVWAESCVNKSPTENLEYHPKFFGDIPKKFSNFPKF